MESIIRFSHRLLEDCIRPGEVAIDGTVGNGNDTILLAKLVGETGHVYGFDVQKEGLENTKEKLVLTGLVPYVTLLHQGHETIGEVIDENTLIGGAIFNLGYLPKSDKSIITKPDTTLKACEEILKRLRIGGRLVIVIYHGHEGGLEEKEALVNYFEKLPQENFHVLRYEYINQINHSPFIIACERRKPQNKKK